MAAVLNPQSCTWNRLPIQTRLLGDHSKREPPDPIPNSAVKPLRADDSVAVCHVKVGHRQAPKPKAPQLIRSRGFFVRHTGHTPSARFAHPGRLKSLWMRRARRIF